MHIPCQKVLVQIQGHQFTSRKFYHRARHSMCYNVLVTIIVCHGFLTLRFETCYRIESWSTKFHFYTTGGCIFAVHRKRMAKVAVRLPPWRTAKATRQSNAW
jgi:hypothetical protein